MIVSEYEKLILGELLEKAFWENKTKNEVRVILKYLIEFKLKFREEEVINKLNYNLLIKYKFKYILRKYNLSPYNLINDLYVEFEKCDSLLKTKGKWTEKNIKQKIIELFSKYKLKTDEDIIQNFTAKFLEENNCKGMLYVTNTNRKMKYRSLYEILEIVYPGRFKRFQLKNKGRNFWQDKAQVIEAVCYIMENKKINKNNIYSEMKSHFFYELGLTGLLAHYNYSYRSILDDICLQN